MMIHHGCHYFLIFKITLRNEKFGQTNTTTTHLSVTNYNYNFFSIIHILTDQVVINNFNYSLWACFTPLKLPLPICKRTLFWFWQIIHLTSVTWPSLIIFPPSSALPHLEKLRDKQSLMIGHNSCLQTFLFKLKFLQQVSGPGTSILPYFPTKNWQI